MQKVGQATPEIATIPDSKTRILRAKLILEEALETVEALGVHVHIEGVELLEEGLVYSASDTVNMQEVADGCADISVVTIGTLIAFGMDDEPLLEEVDASNLRKFGEGIGCTWGDQEQISGMSQPNMEHMCLAAPKFFVSKGFFTG